METQNLVVPDGVIKDPIGDVAGAPMDVVADVDGGVGRKRRGRPPKAVSVSAKPKPKAPVVKKKEEEEDEDVCFICFDGGSLVLCDRRGCPKAYHQACIKRDEEFFQSAAKWNCGWHICSICQKTAHHMCFTCTYSLCKGCIKKADYVCVRGDKGFCTICMKTIMLIENNGQGEDGKVQADFDDKLSWEYLFKVYWVYLKGKLSLTLNELTEAKNPWKIDNTVSSALPLADVHNRDDNPTSISATSLGDLEPNESKRRKIDDQINIVHKETINMVKLVSDASATTVGSDASATTLGCHEWATRELLDFVAHMKKGSTAVLSRFDVQALMLEYINRNNLRDLKKKNQIICDSRLKSLFGKPRVGQIQLIKLLEHHLFTVKEDTRKRIVNRAAVQEDADWASDSKLTLGKDKKRRNRSKGEERALQNKLDEYAAINVHNMNLIYLRCDLMENLLADSESFHDKVVGSIVRIKISGCDLKHDMYRLVQVVGTSKVDIPYKIDSKSTDFMLQILNLDKKETISIDAVSDQEFSQEECRRLQRSIRCGLVKHFTVGEIQEKAMTLQSIKLNDWMENEIVRLNHLRDIASVKGHKKGYRECVEKLQLLKTPDERERRLHAIPAVHSDPKMNPDYESDDTEEYFNENDMDSKYSEVNRTNSRPLKKRAARSNDADRKSRKDEKPANIEDVSTKDASVLTLAKSQLEVNCNDSTITKLDHQTALSSSVSNTAPETIASSVPNDVIWHYLDPNGRVQGPFSLVQLQRWSTTGYFLTDMRIWANHEDKSQLLNDVLKEQLPRYDENLNAANKVVNQTEDLNLCSATPSSTVEEIPYAPNPEKLSLSNGSLGQSFGQNWSANNKVNSSPPTVQLNTSNEADIKHAPTAVFDLPGPAPKKIFHEDEKIPPVMESGNPPSWSSASSLVGGEAKLPVSSDQWGGSSSTAPAKPEGWVDSGIVSVSSFRPPEAVGDHVATPTSNIDQNIHSPQPICNDFTWHGMGEMIEFSTLAEESVSDLLAEVDAMESQYGGVPSPTSKRNSFVDDLFNGSFDKFIPTPDQSTRSDGFSSSGDIQLPCQSNTTTDEHLVGFDFMKTSNCSQQHSFISQMTAIPQRTNMENMDFKWSEMERVPQVMIDINRCAKAEGDEGETEIKTIDAQVKVKLEKRNYIQPMNAPIETSQNHGGGVVQNLESARDNKSIASLSSGHSKEAAVPMQAPKSVGAKLVTRLAQMKGLEGTTNNRRAKDEEDGELIQSEVPQKPLPPPPPLTLGLDPFDPSGLDAEAVQGKSSQSGRLGQGINTGRSGNIGWDHNPSPSQRRYGGERHKSSNSPRERSHQVEDSGYSRNTRSSWNKQSSLGSGSCGGGSSRPPSRGQRVCRFYESGRCKKGDSCKYLHP